MRCRDAKMHRCRGADMEVQRGADVHMCSGFAVVLLSRCRGSAEVIVQVIGDCPGAEQVHWCGAEVQ